MKRILFAIILALCAGNAWASAFVQVQSGNANDGATWGHASPGTQGVDYPADAGGDTFTTGASMTLTVPAGTTLKASGAMTAGTSGAHSKIIVDGTMTLDGNLVPAAYGEVVVNADGVFDVGAYWIEPAVDYQNLYLTFNGTSGHRATLKSTAGTGGVHSVASGRTIWHVTGTYPYWYNLAASTFTLHSNGTAQFDLSYPNFVGCGQIQIGASNNSAAATLKIRHGDFRDWKTGRPLYVEVSTAMTDPSLIEYTTFSKANSNEEIRFRANNGIMQYCVINDSYVNGKEASGMVYRYNIHRQFSYSSQAINGFNTLDHNYWLMVASNDHGVTVGQTAAATLNASVIESGGADNNVVYLSATNPGFTVYNNIMVGLGTFFTTTSPAAFTATMANNTVIESGSIALSYLAAMQLTETYGASGAHYDSNLVAAYKTGNPIRGMHDSTAGWAANQSVVYTDYNDWYQMDDVYSQIAISGLTEGASLGFGLHDLAVNPDFYDHTVSLANFDTAKGGAGTQDNAMAELLKLNGYGGIWNSAYSIANLLDYFSKGATPTNVALRGTGLNGTDIGAVPVVTVPGAPTGATATGGNAQATVSWTAPTDTGSSSTVITGYTVTASPGGATCSWLSGGLNCTVTGLTNGTAYTFTVTASNWVGTGAASSASNSITPTAPASGYNRGSARMGQSQHFCGSCHAN